MQSHIEHKLQTLPARASSTTALKQLSDLEYEQESTSGVSDLDQLHSACLTRLEPAQEWSSSSDSPFEHSTDKRRKKHGLRNARSLYLYPLTPEWLAVIRIFNVCSPAPALTAEGINGYIKISQSGLGLAKTTINRNSTQPVWDELHTVQLRSLDEPLKFKLKTRRKLVKVSTIAETILPLGEFSPQITYQRYLNLEKSTATQNKVNIGMLRIQIRISQKRASLPSSTDTSQPLDQLTPSPRIRKRSTRTMKLSTHSQSIVSLYVPEREDVSSLIMGPLVSGLRTFEARYLGMLPLDHKFHRCKYYARCWSALRTQPAEVVLVRNPITKKMETRSPRLPWPVTYLMGSSALDFEVPTSPRIKQFTSGVLYLTILSACGLRSLQLTRLLNKYRPRQQLGNPSEHTGVVAAEMMAYSQSLARGTERFSTYVQLQFGRDRCATKTQKFTYDPVWNQTFCFAITNCSPFLMDVQLYNIANPNITGPASGIEKLAETLIDISHLPLDITQRMEVELSGPQPRPRLLFLATLTGLSTTHNRHLDYSGTMSQSFEVGTTPKASSPQPRPTVASLQNSEASFQLLPTLPSVSSEFCDPMLLHSVDSQLIEHYGWRNSLANRYDVGFLRVKVIAAADLEAKDLNGKSDPYCVLDLLNMRVQTQTIEKTLSPRWNKTFIFPVTDIHAVLSIRVMDQDKNKSEFLGRLAIPLLWIKNNEQSWYALKDANLRGRARGSLLLEFFFVYNHFKAAWRSLQPREEPVIDGEKRGRVSKLNPNYRQTLQEHVTRLKALFGGMFMVKKAVQDLCSWENPLQTTAVLVGYIITVWNFEPFMVPLGMIAGILANRYFFKTHHLLSVYDSLRAAYGVGASNLLDGRYASSFLPGTVEDRESANGGIIIRKDLLDALNSGILVAEDITDHVVKEDKPRDKEQSKEAKQGKNRFAVIMELMDDLPDILDMVASSFERVNGLFNWNVPWITWLVLILLVVATLVLYFVPFRVILIIIGANLLTKRILRPAHQSTFELFNVLSRIPSMPELEQRRQFLPRAFVYPS